MHGINLNYMTKLKFLPPFIAVKTIKHRKKKFINKSDCNPCILFNHCVEVTAESIHILNLLKSTQLNII